MTMVALGKASAWLLASAAVVCFAAALEVDTSALIFSESFDDGQAFTSGRWVKSANERYAAQEVEIVGYDSLAENITGSYEVRLR